MAYKPGTTLCRKDPQTIKAKVTDGKGGTREVELDDPYNDVRIVGRNPVSHSAGQGSEWEGEQGQEIVIAPIEFGAVIAVPAGQLDDEYEIIDIPDEKPHARPEPAEIPVIDDSSESPERKLRLAEEKAGLEESETREETPLAVAAE